LAAVHILGQPGEQLTPADVADLQRMGLDVKDRIERYCREHGKPVSVAVGCLLGIVWGLERRAGVEQGTIHVGTPGSTVTRGALNRAAVVWDACERTEEIRQRGNIPQRFG
jgi:hypothetical protein